MEEQYTQLCPKCMMYHTSVYKVCSACETPLQPARAILDKRDFISTLIGFSVILTILFCANAVIRAFGQN
jgi:hypothetical protein